MKAVSVLVGLLVIVAILSGCAGVDNSTYRSDNGRGNFGGHSHH